MAQRSLPPAQKEDARARIATVRDLLDKSKPQVLLALPKHMSADRILRLAMTSILRNPTLLECDPRTLIGAVIQCAQLGLEPGSAYGAHLVPFWNNKKGMRDVTVIPDYHGLMQLARNSEQISTIDAHEVYERDEFEFAYGARPYLKHVPCLTRDRGEIKAFYAIAVLKDQGVQFIVLQRWEVEEIRDRYSKSKDNGPWVTNFPEMGKKSCIRRLVDYLPARIELLTAAGLDAKAEQGIPQDLESLAESVQDAELTKALDRASEGIEKGEAKGPYQEPKSNAETKQAEAESPGASVAAEEASSPSEGNPPQEPPPGDIPEPTPTPAVLDTPKPATKPENGSLSGPALRQKCWALVREAAKAKGVSEVSHLMELTGKASLAALDDKQIKKLYDKLNF